MRRPFVLGVLVTAGALSMTVAAFQQPAAPMVVEVDKLKANLEAGDGQFSMPGTGAKKK